MGTRGALGVTIDGQDKITYNHWDSYPEGLGVDTVEKLINMFNTHGVEKVKEMARGIRLVDESKKPTKEDIGQLHMYANIGVGNQSLEDWYCLLRGLQGQIDKYLKVGVMTDARSFLDDSLFCEYAYIFNFDTMKLEMYQGFQSAPHDKGRFANNNLEQPEWRSGGPYYPVALVKEFDYDDLMSPGFSDRWMDEAFPPSGDEDEDE